MRSGAGSARFRSRRYSSNSAWSPCRIRRGNGRSPLGTTHARDFRRRLTSDRRERDGESANDRTGRDETTDRRRQEDHADGVRSSRSSDRGSRTERRAGLSAGQSSRRRRSALSIVKSTLSGTLGITGSNGADDIRIGRKPHHGDYVINANRPIRTPSPDCRRLGGDETTVECHFGDGASNVIFVFLSGGPDTLRVAAADYASLGASAGTGEDTVISGAQGGDLVWGDDGDDRLRGGGGRDALQGSRGDDTLRGGSGADRLVGGRGRTDASAVQVPMSAWTAEDARQERARQARTALGPAALAAERDLTSARVLGDDRACCPACPSPLQPHPQLLGLAVPGHVGELHRELRGRLLAALERPGDPLRLPLLLRLQRQRLGLARRDLRPSSASACRRG